MQLVDILGLLLLVVITAVLFAVLHTVGLLGGADRYQLLDN
jgi:hypothetical protein